MEELRISVPEQSLRHWMNTLEAALSVRVVYQEDQLEMAHETIAVMKQMIESVKHLMDGQLNSIA